MQKKTIIVGVDLKLPLNEMLAKVAYALSQNKKNDYICISIKKTKKNQNIFSKTITLGFNKWKNISKFFIFLFLPLFIVFFRIKGYNNLIILWSGFEPLDSLIILISRLVKIHVVYFLINKKQLNLVYKFKRNFFINFVTFNALVAKKSSSTLLTLPIIFLDNFLHKQSKKYKNDFLFLTVPANVKDFEKRGVYLLFMIAKKFKNNIYIYNRWPHLDKHLNEIKNKYNVTNIIIKTKFVKNLANLIMYHKGVINLDKGDEVPLVPMSVFETLFLNQKVLLLDSSPVAMQLKTNNQVCILNKNLKKLSQTINECNKKETNKNYKLNFQKRLNFLNEKFNNEIFSLLR